MSVIFADCMECKHLIYNKHGKYPSQEDYSCKAYPNGIPKEYFWGNDDKKNCGNGIGLEKE